MENANAHSPWGRHEASLEGLSADEAVAYACAKYLELESMVKRLAEKHGLPATAVWLEVITGYEDIAQR